MSATDTFRQAIRVARLADEASLLSGLIASHAPSPETRARASRDAEALVEKIRAGSEPGLMEVFLAEYGLSTEEGVALMCLAEALLRVPDADTMDALIEDKIAPSEWGRHLGKSSSSLVNASTWALMLTGNVLAEPADRGVASVLRGAVKRLGEPVIRTAVRQAMKELGRQFVLGQTIEEAMTRASIREKSGFTHSYDMLGEAALTERDADEYFDAYAEAIRSIAKNARHAEVRQNPGISVKLSALHPRYELNKHERVLKELVPRLSELARMAASANIGLNVDAEEADRLDISLDVMEHALRDRSLSGWDGFGIVIQAYGKRAAATIDWVNELAGQLSRKLMVRLVKGAYWDTEIKRAQVAGLGGYPVFTQKPMTDVAYLCCANKLLGMTDRIYPQFATHNAHSVATILAMGADKASYEFQRLHGMGEALHDIVRREHGTNCRIYAPVGAHRDLLAYLVRRLLENGANSSFVNQIVDKNVPASEIARDPFAMIEKTSGMKLPLPADIFGTSRRNSTGWDLTDDLQRAQYLEKRTAFRETVWRATPLLAVDASSGDRETVSIVNPAIPGQLVGTLEEANATDVEHAFSNAKPWDVSASERANILRRASDIYEANSAEFFALLAREAGKTAEDAIAELREAVDFLRYYACETERLDPSPRGIFTCISPWNFPLAIFTGQIAAALAAGNAVLAKSAESTPLVAARAVEMLHQAGVPRSALQYLPGRGRTVGAALTSDPRIAGTCFTGSTATAQAINRAMAENVAPGAPLIAETGGLNAMIVDSTALPEQAVRDIVMSAFRSAGQRCSALRMLYIQKDIEKPFLTMLEGAARELSLGDPWDLSTDVGPVITDDALRGITEHVDKARAQGRLVYRGRAPADGHFVAPAIIRLGGIEEMEKEIFGPVLHVATFEANEVDKVVSAVNASGYGLTFGLHTRIDDRVEDVTAKLHVGNIYINRNQIGAVVGSQPFGGEGMSGTGPKAGGPHYLTRFAAPTATASQSFANAGQLATAPINGLQKAIAAARRNVRSVALSEELLPGPTGESNRFTTYARGVVLCLGPDDATAAMQVQIAENSGCGAVALPIGDAKVASGFDPAVLQALEGFDVVAFDGEPEAARLVRRALAARAGPLVPLASSGELAGYCIIERHVCIDTTAAGGNATLLAEMS